MREILITLAKKKSTMELSWIPTETMASEGADPLTRNWVTQFEDLFSLSKWGARHLKKLVKLDGKDLVDLFASVVDNPYRTRYCHIAWDTDDRLALGCDAFAYLEALRSRGVEQTLYAYGVRFPVISFLFLLPFLGRS